MGVDDKAEKWALLRKPFDADEIEKLPRYVGHKVNGKIPYDAYGYCEECKKRHPLPAIHLDYVGHAGITDRLNDVDPEWNWEPLAHDQFGLPLFDGNGGLWIKLTVLGVTRYGYGDAQGKSGPNAVKEVIGDAIRNAAMRFGVATYLWSKSDKAEHMRDFSEPQELADAEPVDAEWLDEQVAILVPLNYIEEQVRAYLTSEWNIGGREHAQQSADKMVADAQTAQA